MREAEVQWIVREADLIKTINLTADVPPNREMRIQLPDEVPPGPADIVVVVAPRGSSAGRTLGELLRSDFFGMWRERTDIDDSARFAQRLREEAWRRPN